MDNQHNKQLNEGRNITTGQFIYGGFPKMLNEAKKLAKKDYNKNGKLESSEVEYLGAKDNAIKAKMGKVDESFDTTDFEVVEELLEELFDENELDLIIEVAEKKKWIQKAIKKEGSLRKTLKVKKGKKIPEKKLEAAAKKGGKTGKRARLAMTLKKLNEETNPARQLEVHMGTLGKFGQELHRTNHPNRYKYGKIWVEFSQGNYNNADELIKLGADPEAVGNYIKIATSPEYKAHQKEVQSKITPEQMGYNRKDNWTGD